MPDPLVSVVMATYNGERFLPAQLQSIIDQSYNKLEIIIVDDASTDSTPALLKQFQQQDPRIQVVGSDQNRGVIASFEEALRRASGDFIVLSDQDDVFHPDKIRRQVDILLEAADIDLVVSDLAVIDDNGTVTAPSLWKHQRLAVQSGKPLRPLLYVNFVTGCATMMRRRLLQAALPFPADCIMHDWWLSVVSCRAAGGGIALLPEPLTYYRQHGTNVIGAHDGGLAASIARAPTVASRCAWYQRNARRIEGYMSRQLWSADDRRLLEQTHALFSLMARDDTNGFMTRLASLPQRLRYALSFGAVHTLGILIFAIMPRSADWLRRI